MIVVRQTVIKETIMKTLSLTTFAMVVFFGLTGYAAAEATPEMVVKSESTQVQVIENTSTAKVESKIEEKQAVISQQDDSALKPAKATQSVEKEIKISGMICPPDCDQ